MVLLLFLVLVGLVNRLVFSYNLTAYYETYDASIYDYPFVALVVTEEGFGCTAVIITRIWLAIPASCVLNIKIPRKLRIIAGVDDLDLSSVMVHDNLQINNIQSRRGIKIFPHPSYKPGKLAEYDIALIRIGRSFQTTKSVKPLELKAEFWPPQELKVCIVVGWMVQIGTTNISRRLQFFYTYAKFGHYSCPCLSEYWKNRARSLRLICLERDGSGVCPGDVGAVLLCDGAIVGLSHALIDKRCSSKTHKPMKQCQKFDFITAFTDICPMLSWLHSHINIAGTLPQQCAITPFYIGESTKILIILVILFLFAISYALSII